MTYNVDCYLSQICNMSNRFGNYLMELMSRYNKNRLKDITLDEAKEFYEELVKK